MTYVATLLVQLDEPLTPEDAQRVAERWADRSDVTLDAVMTGELAPYDGPVLRVAGRIDVEDIVDANRVYELRSALDEVGALIDDYHEVSVLSLAEHDRQGKARAVAASAS